MRYETRPATGAELDRAAGVLGEAFADYPWTRWTVDPVDHQQRITALQRVALEHYGFPYGQVWVTASGDRLHTVAVWLDSAIDVPAAVQALVSDATARLEGSRHGAAIAAEAEISGWRPGGRHFLLAMIGTVPSMQRRGLAALTLAPVLASLDDEGIDAFLETSSQSNVDLYTGFGFRVVDHRRIGGGLDVWAMIRSPRAC
jgi:GNAT superfamily N-acetyltransferase